MTLRIHRIDDPPALRALDALKADHRDVRATFAGSEAVAARLIDGVRQLTVSAELTPWLVLRGGLAGWRALLERAWMPIGLLGARKEGEICTIPYVSIPPLRRRTEALLIDWIMATGATLEAAVRATQGTGLHSGAVHIAVALSCQEGEARLDNIRDLDVHLYCFDHGRSATGLLLGYDIGEYAVGFTKAAENS